MNDEVMPNQEVEEMRSKAIRERAERDAAILAALNDGYFAGVCPSCKLDLVVAWAECTRFKDSNAKFIPTTKRCNNPGCNEYKIER